MSEILTLFDRPTKPGLYRAQVNFSRTLPYLEILNRLRASKGQYAYAPGKVAEFGVYAALDGTQKWRYLDSTSPLAEWSFPPDTQWHPGAAIVHRYSYVGNTRLPEADYMVVYLNLHETAPLAPDGAKPIRTLISRTQRTIVEEWSEEGHRFRYPFQSQQQQLSGFFLPLLAKVGLIAIDALIVYLMYASGVFSYASEVFFNYLGKAVQQNFPALLAGAGVLALWSLVEPFNHA